MSRSTFLTTSSFEANEATSHSPANTNPNVDRGRTLRFHHRLMPTISSSSRSNETLPVVVLQTSSTTTTTGSKTTTTTNTAQHKSVVRINPAVKRNLRGKRRSTGIRPDEVTLANAVVDLSLNQDDEDEDKTSPSNPFISIKTVESCESSESNQTNPSKPLFTVSRLQPTFDENSHRSLDKLAITRPAMASSSSSSSSSSSNPKMFLSEEFILRRQGSDDDPALNKRRQLEERINTLEALVYEKDSIIHDLQRKLEKLTREFNDAEQQIYTLQRDKLTLIKTLSTLQETKTPSGGDHSTATKRTGFITRN